MKLLSYYGFAVAENPHDTVPMQLEVGGRVKELRHLARALRLKQCVCMCVLGAHIP